jgi:hypothetical protein
VREELGDSRKFGEIRPNCAPSRGLEHATFEKEGLPCSGAVLGKQISKDGQRWKRLGGILGLAEIARRQKAAILRESVPAMREPRPTKYAPKPLFRRFLVRDRLFQSNDLC